MRTLTPIGKGTYTGKSNINIGLFSLNTVKSNINIGLITIASISAGIIANILFVHINPRVEDFDKEVQPSYLNKVLSYLITCIGPICVEENGSASLILIHQA